MKIEIPYDHENPKDCQLFIAMTGSKEQMKEHLARILKQFDSPYGKPCQGSGVHYQCTTYVSTPV